MSDEPISELIKAPFPEDLKNRKAKKQTILTASVTPRDKEIAAWLAGFFGTSKSDVLRTAVRHLYSEVCGGVFKRPLGE